MKTIDFMGKKNLVFVVSAAIIVAGLVFMLASGLNLGIDFSGGTIIQIDLGEHASVQDVKAITDSFDSSASIVHAGEDGHEIIIRTTLEVDNRSRLELLNGFKARYGIGDEDLLKVEKVGAAVSNELKRNAIISILVATLGSLAYITFRFQWKFGVAAVIALIHDVLVVISFFAIFRIPVNTSFVAAILTIVGYSINDTIVVFDKLRENLKFNKRLKTEELVNQSVSQTLVRSINTSMTTLLTIGTLYVLGVDDVKTFALPLIAGVLSGTYSSIFIASPVWSIISKKKVYGQ